MYLVDANILLYSTDEGSEHHAAARDWLDERTAGTPRSVGLPWPSLLAFFRLVTNPRVYSPPATAADAWQRIEDWLSRPAAWIPLPLCKRMELRGSTAHAACDGHISFWHGFCAIWVVRSCRLLYRVGLARGASWDGQGERDTDRQ